MKYFYFTIVCFFALLSYTNASMEKRGTATMMKFGGENQNSALTRRNRGTWYSGKDLSNAACYGRKGLPSFSAHVSDMIGAMAMKHFEYCYECMRITNVDNERSIVVKIVDKCAGCKIGTAIDLTPGAFKKLNPDGLEAGVLDITWKVVPCPSTIKLALS
ncbi:RlpA-like double-psi beta-barrel-protein domain-containing protein-containing protein [Halteromyces radiatus]|uniref:RlpA-like double-psi beta-barrel-protein domain-containing protein-containing protein n=1 Tax=Halteromyces radiatus TaxID=101107 RepID=UPI0022211EC3|nr:RlpA-like double-psi beta-barrel-protein domain-containing protein-containing protein [Halteromyces radiatus]KAI8089497.1 RlpA-like double-psi beta-barrel-protein domain-containing protein-containing protein [Halteromyces radiatus]